MNGKKEEIEYLKYSYDKALDIFRLHNDNYFKRTQIIMIAIQAGFFFVIIKLLTPIPDSQKELIVPMIVTLLGFAVAWAWRVLMTKQMQYMMLLKKYIQNLEAKFVDLKLPIDYFSIEAAISQKFPKDYFETMTADIDDIKNPKKDGKYYNFAKFKWSGKERLKDGKKSECPKYREKSECPENRKESGLPNWFVRNGWLEPAYEHQIGVPIGGMVKIEKWLSRGIQWIWLFGFISLLTLYFDWL